VVVVGSRDKLEVGCIGGVGQLDPEISGCASGAFPKTPITT
jgi:hypothetical protein